MAKAKEAPAPATPEAEESTERKPRTHPESDKVITLLVNYNPKRAGSASHARFANYEDGQTVAEAIAAGVTAGDINWDVKHEFIVLGDKFMGSIKKKDKPEPKPRAAKEDVEAEEAPAPKGKPKAAPAPEVSDTPAPAPKRRR